MDEIIKKNKPSISDSTLKTYCSLLRSLYYKEHEKGTAINTEFFNKQEHVIKLLEDKPAASRKTTFAALIAITDADNNDKYKAGLMADGKTYDKFIKTQTKTETQEANWMSFDEVREKYEKMAERVKPLLNSKVPLNQKDFYELQDFIILSVTNGLNIPPRRSTDWCAFKIKNIDKGHDNYLDKNFFHFNKYKTAKFYNEQIVECPIKLKNILLKWFKLNPHDYLLVDKEGKPLSNVRLTQILNRIFDGLKISTSMLRHFYLTEKLKNVPALAELEKQAHDMGHSLTEALEYVKK